MSENNNVPLSLRIKQLQRRMIINRENVCNLVKLKTFLDVYELDIMQNEIGEKDTIITDNALTIANHTLNNGGINFNRVKSDDYIICKARLCGKTKHEIDVSDKISIIRDLCHVLYKINDIQKLLDLNTRLYDIIREIPISSGILLDTVPDDIIYSRIIGSIWYYISPFIPTVYNNESKGFYDYAVRNNNVLKAQFKVDRSDINNVKITYIGTCKFEDKFVEYINNLFHINNRRIPSTGEIKSHIQTYIRMIFSYYNKKNEWYSNHVSKIDYPNDIIELKKKIKEHYNFYLKNTIHYYLTVRVEWVYIQQNTKPLIDCDYIPTIISKNIRYRAIPKKMANYEYITKFINIREDGLLGVIYERLYMVEKLVNHKNVHLNRIISYTFHDVISAYLDEYEKEQKCIKLLEKICEQEENDKIPITKLNHDVMSIIINKLIEL